MFKFLAAATAASALLACSPAMAGTVVFIPTTNVAGGVLTANNNDLYAMGRGVVFKATSNFNLTSVSLYQSLFGQNLTFSIRKGGALTGNVAGGTMVWSGTQAVTTSGLGLIDFALPEAIILEEGETYFLNFSFGGSSDANFYYTEGGSPSYDAPGFSGVNGVADGNTDAPLIPRIELGGETPPYHYGGAEFELISPGGDINVSGAVPEPGTWALMILGFGGAGAVLRRRRAQVLATA